MRDRHGIGLTLQAMRSRDVSCDGALRYMYAGFQLFGMNAEEARTLLSRYVHKENLIRHCLATAAIMRRVAEHLGEDAEKWEVIGILHDIDYEVVGEDMQRHGVVGYQILREQGVDEETAEAARRHNDLLFGDSDAPVDIALQAADNISGLVIASAMVKRGAISEVTPDTVKKKFKERSFAAGCRREKVRGIERFIDLPTFYRLAIEALQGIRGDLGLS
jgi:putative nucleotidyltransferase with HDIG domain